MSKSKDQLEEEYVTLDASLTAYGEGGLDSEFDISIGREIYREIESYSGSDTTKELGGLLLGRVEETVEGCRVIIEGQVEALYTEALKGSITFTHQSWDYMHSEREKRYPGLRIVGWYHTHPGFGIFLSSYDLFIHRNFFDIPWQLAYVVDPVNDKRGFFRWQEGDIVPCASRIIDGQAALRPLKKPLKAKIVAFGVLLLAAAGYWWYQSWQTAEHITLPPPVVQEKSVTVAQPVEKSYEIKPGNTLCGISETFYGTPYKYEQIANRNGIANPDVIRDGQKIIIPDLKQAGDN